MEGEGGGGGRGEAGGRLSATPRTYSWRRSSKPKAANSLGRGYVEPLLAENARITEVPTDSDCRTAAILLHTNRLYLLSLDAMTYGSCLLHIYTPWRPLLPHHPHQRLDLAPCVYQTPTCTRFEDVGENTLSAPPPPPPSHQPPLVAFFRCADVR